MSCNKDNFIKIKLIRLHSQLNQDLSNLLARVALSVYFIGGGPLSIIGRMPGGGIPIMVGRMAIMPR